MKNPESSTLRSNQKYIIPHYIGARCGPTYPPTEAYAKAVLILHVPWANKFDEQDTSRKYVEEFELFLKSGLCPMSVKIAYDRAKTQYEQKAQFHEPTGKKETIFYEPFPTTVDESVEENVALASTLGLTSVADIQYENEYFYGDESTNWSEQHYQVCGEGKHF